MPWRREWQPTPVFLLGEFHRQRSLADYRPWGYKEWDTSQRVGCDWATNTFTFKGQSSIQSESESHWVMSDSLRVSTVHGILQARIARYRTQVSRIAGGFFTSWATRSPRILESWSRNWTGVSCIAGRFFINWAIREAQYTKRLNISRKDNRNKLQKLKLMELPNKIF